MKLRRADVTRGLGLVRGGAFLAVFLTGAVAACSHGGAAEGRTTVATTSSAPIADGGAPTAASESTEGTDGAGAEQSGRGSGRTRPLTAVCRAYESDQADPLLRWIGAFPVHRGGVVMAFVGPHLARMDVEASLEMAGIMGYEVEVCDSAVVVWVPGIECGEGDAALAQRIEEGTSMSLGEASCFRSDEVRVRLREECARGTVQGEVCP